MLRIFGLDRIPAALPGIPGADAPPPEIAENLIRRDRVRRQLAASGYAEAIHFAFLDPARDAAFPSLRPEALPIRLANPISEQLSVLRRSLVPSLVETARFNQRRGLPAVRAFEIANVFYQRPEGGIPDQPEHVGLLCGGRLGTPWEREVELDLFDLKGVIEALAGRYLSRTQVYRAEAKAHFVDKMLGNFSHIGLIHLMFPLAAIIDVRRHPLGCGFSCFKQLFARGHGYTYDLSDLGRYYRDYAELMEHVDAVLPQRLHRVYYEQLVADPPEGGEIRGVAGVIAGP